ncbi:MAG: CotH kinase family protein, partial [Planctomycetota bacterium]
MGTPSHNAPKRGPPGLCAARHRRSREQRWGRRRRRRLRLEPLEPRVLLSGHPLITEFMAANDTTLLDVDGDRPDWVELHNPTAATVSLDGWHLTDDASHLSKWPFPAVTVEPGDYLVVFASEKDRRDPAGELHTNFALKSDGEYLALVDPGGTPVSEYAWPYPSQRADVSYGLAPLEAETLVMSHAPASALVPTDDSLGLTWTQADFDDSGWAHGTTGVGYDRRSGYEHLLGLDLGGAMYDVTTTAYVRVPFTVADPAAIDVLTLRMKYDDGFVAYLNGTEVARRNAPGTLGYDAAAPQGHADAAAVVFEDIDLSGHLGLLEPGGNVLAIHALNVGTTSSDLLILPELVAGDTDVDPAARRFFVVPTPGSANAEGYLGLAADPAFDHERGFYGSGFDLHLTSDTDGATIRYTTDGATPSATAGDVYQSPIPIDTTTVVRAVAVKDGFVASGVETHTYLFAADVATQGNSPAGYPSEWKNDSGWLPADYEMDPEIAQAAAYADVLDDALLAIPTISLVTDVEHLFDPHTGIYMNPRESGVAWERPVSAELLHPDGTAGFQIDAGLRIQGGASRLPSKSPKHSFRLLFKGIHGPTKLEYPLFGDDAAAEFDTITLRAGFNQSWIHHNTVMGDQRGRAQYVRDQWAKDTQLAMGGLAPHNDYAHLYVNGLYWGLYNPTERPDAAFAAAYLGGDKADYDALNSGEPVDGNRERWNQLFDLVNAGVQTEAQYQAVAQRLDIDSFIDYMVLNHYAGNRDWDHHNWYAFARRDTAGKFYFASWDAESIFIGSGDDRTGLDHDRCPSRLLNRLAENAEFRVRFADRVHAHFHNDGALTPENVVARWSTRADQVYEAVVAESARWGDYRRDVHPLGTPRDLYERDVHWAAERDRLLTDYFPGRTDTVLQQYRDRGLYPVLDAPAFSQHGGSIGPGFELAIANPNAAGTVYYTLDGSDPREAGGAVSLGARMYTGEAVELAVTTRVRARVFDGAQWSALTEAAFRSDAPDALISEFMADNDGTLADEDGEFTDWIEVHNPTAIPVSLADWLLTDDPAREDVWQFPAVTLGPGDYLVVFASGKDRAVAGAELHTDFRLNDGGEYLALVEPDGSVACAFAPEYARQTSDVSYGLATDRVSRTVMAPGAPVRTLVPSDGSLGLAWTEAGYDDSGWEAGTTAVGYEADTGYEALLGAEVAMRHVNPSAYARIPFYVADPSDLLSLSLRIKYDDGFVAYLNGHEAAARLAPATPQWDSTSTGQRQDAQCLVYEEIDLSDDVGFLTVGRNVLALHGLNANVTSSDLLLLPEMVATTAVVDPGLHRYFAAPTPGLPNVAGGAALGPVIAEVSHSPAVPQDGEDIVVTAAVRPAFEPLGAVTLRFRVGFGSETALVMTDDGTGADAQAGDGLYTAAIPSGASGPGEMVRWRVTAADAAGGSSRRPLFPDPLDSPEYFGTVVADPSIVSNLPVLHWFVADPAAADTRGGTRCSVFYDGEFYDNVRVDLHGQSTAGFPKKSYDFDFNADDRFRYADGERRVKDFNLLTNWADKAKVRNTMAYEVYRSAGAPYHVAFPVRVHQNGAFFSVADWVEDGDDRYLDRLGLDPDGALYKVYNDLATASRAEKKTRKDEGNADLQALVDGLHLTGEARTQFLFDHVNIPEVVNFLAATVVTANRDLGHKNYYVYRDTEGTGLWHVLPWDVDLSFGRNWTREEHYYDDTMYWDNSVFVGAHNQLFGALYQTPAVREMFLRRVRTLMDQLLQPPGTPPEALRLEQRVADLVALIDPHDDDPHQGSDDADLDYQAWGSWGNGNAMRPAAARITDEFLPARRHFLYHDQSVAHGGEIPDPQPDLGAWPPGYQHVTFGTMAFNPTSGEQEEEYVEIVNHNGFAVDASGWELRGAVELTLPPGTVLPAGGTLYASPDVNAFRAR